jgi:hypothetical protein
MPPKNGGIRYNAVAGPKPTMVGGTMNCPLCDSASASTTELTIDWTVLHCGEVKFNTAAYADLARLSADEKARVADYCRTQMNLNEVITPVRLADLIKK